MAKLEENNYQSDVIYQLPQQLVVGATHAPPADLTNATYGERPLNQAAQIIKGMGFEGIFVYLTVGTGNKAHEMYSSPQNPWPNNIPETPLELAQSAPFVELFNRDFSLFVLTTYTAGIENARATLEHPQTNLIAEIASFEGALKDEEEAFYQLTKYLLATYQSTDKTFILKNWEGDGIVESAYSSIDAEMSVAYQKRLIRWFQARQRGVERARREAPSSGVKVLHAIEVNKVKDAATKKRFINGVLPYADADMVSYSAWEAMAETRNYADTVAELTAALNSINFYAPDPLNLGRKRLLISEFGLRENMPTLSASDAQQWCTSNCSNLRLGDLVESGRNNGYGLILHDDGQTCFDFNIPNGISAQISKSLTIEGPASLQSICGATFRVSSPAYRPFSQTWRLDAVIDAARKFGISSAFIWQLYDNDCLANTLSRTDCLYGNWLIRPDGSAINWQPPA